MLISCFRSDFAAGQENTAKIKESFKKISFHKINIVITKNTLPFNLLNDIKRNE